GFQEVFDVGVPALVEGFKRLGHLEGAIIFTQLTLLAEYPDSLIARKRGRDEAEHARQQARGVLDTGWPLSASGQAAFDAFDAWLADGRNPGTSADLVTACLFSALRDDLVPAIPFAAPSPPR